MFFSKRRLDYIFTFFTEFVVLLAGVLVYRFAAQTDDANSFSEYALSRRVISFIQPILILGLGVGLPRYISIARAQNDRAMSDSYYISAIILVFSFSLVLISALLLFPSFFSLLFFGDTAYSSFIFPMTLMLAGLVFHSVVYSYYRGLIKMVHANLFQIINLGMVPLFVFYFENQIDRILLFTGLGWIIVASFFLLLSLSKIKIQKSLIAKAMKDLARYGIQRVPGDLAIAGLFSLPAIFVAHTSGVDQAGNLAFSISLLNMAGAVFGPICLILLPEASRLIVEKKFDLLFSQIRKISTLTIALTSLGLLLYLVFAPQILTLYLGQAPESLVLISRIVLISSIGYTIYISLRSVLDAYYIKAVNTINIVVALLFFVLMGGIVFFFQLPLMVLVFSFVFSNLLLGVLTILEILKIRKQKITK